MLDNIAKTLIEFLKSEFKGIRNKTQMTQEAIHYTTTLAVKNRKHH